MHTRKAILLATTACFLAVPVVAAEAPSNANTPKVEKKVDKAKVKSKVKARKGKVAPPNKLAPGKDKPQG